MKNKKLKRGLYIAWFIVIVLLITMLIISFYSDYYNNSSSNKEIIDIIKVIDGDTITINNEIIRLIGIDASEKGSGCYDEAKERLEELLANKDASEIRLEKDADDKDKYNRSLRYLYVENNDINNLINNNSINLDNQVSISSSLKNTSDINYINVNILLVKEGFARVFIVGNNTRFQAELSQAEILARENQEGCLWG